MLGHNAKRESNTVVRQNYQMIVLWFNSRSVGYHNFQRAWTKDMERNLDKKTFMNKPSF
jgi:hypothetical protein